MPFALFAVLSDVAIAASLCVLLNGHKTTFKRYSVHNAGSSVEVLTRARIGQKHLSTR